MNTFARTCLIALGGAVVLGLVGCSDPLSNDYGGWYWQMPEISSSSAPAVATNSSSTTTTTTTTTHAKAEPAVNGSPKG
jgi:hypothetical protein